MRTMIVGHGGRESALAAAMAEHSELCAFMGHENPSIVHAVHASGGSCATGDVRDPAAVAAFARDHEIDIAMVSADEPLAAGVVDALLAQGTRAVGPTRAGAEIEWNKVFARELLAEVAPLAAPVLRVVSRPEEVDRRDRVLRLDACRRQAVGSDRRQGREGDGPPPRRPPRGGRVCVSLLAAGGAGETVLIEEKVVGAEFTIQAVSDGRTVVCPPATYDYPYRYDGDEGPGTGGMGSLSLAARTLPFMTDAHYEQACSIIEQVIERLAHHGRRFSGVMNSGFFATADGVKVIEFNARFGDPECMNIMSLFAGSWPETMERIAAGSLTAADVRMRDEASLVLYLVSPDYALRAGPAYDFKLDVDRLAAQGCRVFFSSAVQTAERSYRTVGTSRAVALACTAPTLEQARAVTAAGAESIPVLEWRRDVGDAAYLDGLSRLVAGQHAGRERGEAPGQRLAQQSA